MRLLLTTGSNAVSSIIRRLTKEDASHLAMYTNDYVIHSTFFGIRWEKYDDFIVHTEVIAGLDLADDHKKMLRFSAEHVGKGGYDFGGLLYCGARYLLRLIGIRLPKKNLWQMTGMFMCTELVSAYLSGEEDAMSTPRQLFDSIVSGSSERAY